MYKLDLEKEKNRDQIANIYLITEKAKEFQKTIYFCFVYYAKAFDCMDHNKLENSSRVENTRPPYLSPEKPVCGSRRNRIEHGTTVKFKIEKGVKLYTVTLFI